MNIEDVRLLFEYNAWANQRILTTAERLSEEQLLAQGIPGFEGVRSILVHTLDTEYGWRMLCQQHMFTSSLSEETFATVAAIAEGWQQEQQAMHDYLASLNDADLTGVIRYTNDLGEPRERVLWHCLVHVVNHGTQHRSEAAIRLTEAGHSPGELDFTTFLNERR